MKKTSTFQNGLIWFGAGVSLAEILTGTSFAGLGFAKGLAAIVAGHVIGCGLFFLAGLIGGRSGKSAMETVKMSFGQKGGLLFAALNVLQLVGWTAIMIYDGALAAGSVFPAGHWVWCLVIGGLIVLAAMPLVMAYARESLSEQAMYYLRNMLLINTYYVMGAAVNTTLIAGVFRAGGDSRFGFVCDTIDMWCYAVPLGFIAAFALKLPVMWVYFLLCTDEFVKWPWVLGHYRKGTWLKNITREGLFTEEKG